MSIATAFTVGVALGSTLALLSVAPVRRYMAARNRRRGRLRIAIDMVEVMADALAELLRRYNSTFGARVTAEDLHGRHLEEWVPAIQREAVEAMYNASFFADLPIMQDCVEVVRELSDRHDVLVVTAAMEVPCSFDAKFQWLQRHFPFIPASNIVFCGEKGIVDADYLIDDRPRHFARFQGSPLLFSAPHNAKETRYPRVNSWREVRDYFARLDRRNTGVSLLRQLVVRENAVREVGTRARRLKRESV
jgi:5'(3')-deoxyribonucleotidase